MRIILLVLLTLLIQTDLIQAQESSETSTSSYNPLHKPNIVKLNLSSLLFKNFGVQYERILGNHISVACQVRLMPESQQSYNEIINDLSDADSNLILDKWKVSSFAVTPEFRYYPRHAGKGFYLAPYLRYRTFSMDVPASYYDSDDTLQSLSIKGKSTTLIGGLMIGSQFRLGNSVTLDWFIIGFQYGISNADLDIKTSRTLDAVDQADIRQDLEDLKSDLSAFNKMEYTVGANGGTIEGRFGAVGIRGFGLNLGIRF